MPDKLTRYLDEIGSQIRWKRARPVLLMELNDHALEQLDTCLSSGLSQAEAEAETLRQLGDPVEIGQALDRLHRPRPQFGLLALTGVLTVAAAILQILLLDGWDAPVISHTKLLFFSILGFGALAAGYFVNYMELIRHSTLIYWGAVAAALLLLVVSPVKNGRSYGPHYITMLYPLIYGLVLRRLRGRGLRGLVLAFLSLVPLILPILLIPRLSQLLILLVSGGTALLLAAGQDWFGIGKRRGLAYTAGTLTASCCVLGWLGHRYIANLIQQGLHPELEPLGQGYMAMAIRSVLAGAKLWGTGEIPGQLEGQSYWSLVPDGAHDAFLVTVIHYLGWVPFLLLCLGLCTLLVWSLVKTLRQKRGAPVFLSLSILFIFGLNTLLGLSLSSGHIFFSAFCPFLQMSAETILNLGLMGILLSIFRQETLPFHMEPEPPYRPKGTWKLVYVSGQK